MTNFLYSILIVFIAFLSGSIITESTAAGIIGFSTAVFFSLVILSKVEQGGD